MSMAAMSGKPIQPEELERELPVAAEGEDAVQPASVLDSAAATESAEVSELQKLRAERDTLFDRLARTQAEFDNFRKRNAREQQEFREYALVEAVRSLLPALDSLDLALKNSAGDKSELHAGVELTRKQLADALAKLGLTEITALGQAFDPQWHQAIEMVETAETPDHHVLEELQRGYKLKERLLRPAMVRVAQAPQSKQ
jgi:molecular chaperone GrpE